MAQVVILEEKVGEEEGEDFLVPLPKIYLVFKTSTCKVEIQPECDCCWLTFVY